MLPRHDLDLIQRVHPIVGAITDPWFRAEVHHLERVPDRPTLLIGNHDGANLPVDGICFGVAWYRHFKTERPLRILMHAVPFQLSRRLRDFLHGMGCVSATSVNFESAAERGETVLLYPGAAREAFRTYRNRRNIDLGGRTGFVVRALRWGLPITPVASVGAHETMFILARGQKLARWLGIDKRFHADVWPLIAGFPFGLWFNPLIPHLPLPAKITIEVQPTIDLTSVLSEQFGRRIGPKDAGDRSVVQAGFELVRNAVQVGVERLYARRKWPIIG